eukprot:1152919-Pelagomonas_calceolata.AAC.2
MRQAETKASVVSGICCECHLLCVLGASLDVVRLIAGLMRMSDDYLLFFWGPAAGCCWLAAGGPDARQPNGVHVDQQKSRVVEMRACCWLLLLGCRWSRCTPTEWCARQSAKKQGCWDEGLLLAPAAGLQVVQAHSC